MVDYENALQGSSQGRSEARWNIVTKITSCTEVRPSLGAKGSPPIADVCQTSKSRIFSYLRPGISRSSTSGCQICTILSLTCQHSAALSISLPQSFSMPRCTLAPRSTCGVSEWCYMCLCVVRCRLTTRVCLLYMPRSSVGWSSTPSGLPQVRGQIKEISRW
jgi:hypothetical protein